MNIKDIVIEEIAKARYENVKTWDREGPGWIIFDCEDYYYSIAYFDDEITHWMPDV
jgi:hypothetical protein